MAVACVHPNVSAFCCQPHGTAECFVLLELIWEEFMPHCLWCTST
jgi:hypothetical protein